MAPDPPARQLPSRAAAVLWDIDGTLVDSWRLAYDATARILSRHGLPAIDEATYHSCTRYSTPERFARHAGLEPGDPEFETTGELLGGEFDDTYIALVSTTTAGFYPGIAEVLAAIPPHVKLGAVTNACERYAHAALAVNSPPLYARFGCVLGADTADAPKPAPGGLLQCCRALGVAPAACVYVGDSPSDARAAAAAGMACVGVVWGSHTRGVLGEAPFTRLCGDVEELGVVLGGVTK